MSSSWGGLRITVVNRPQSAKFSPVRAFEWNRIGSCPWWATLNDLEDVWGVVNAHHAGQCIITGQSRSAVWGHVLGHLGHLAVNLIRSRDMFEVKCPPAPSRRRLNRSWHITRPRLPQLQRIGRLALVLLLISHGLLRWQERIRDAQYPGLKINAVYELWRLLSLCHADL